jgi:hypothetical protein
LLALIIGFNVAMAIGHYDQRTNNEEREASAIGTEYLRLGVLADNDTNSGRRLLEEYLNDRLRFYDTVDPKALERVDADTTQLQVRLWNAVRSPALATPTPVMALVVSGMNDVLNAQRYTQAAYWDRIPPGAWSLMAAIAIFANVMIGYSSRRETQENGIFIILPVVLAISFMLIADIDSPRGVLSMYAPQISRVLRNGCPNFTPQLESEPRTPFIGQAMRCGFDQLRTDRNSSIGSTVRTLLQRHMFRPSLRASRRKRMASSAVLPLKIATSAPAEKCLPSLCTSRARSECSLA